MQNKNDKQGVQAPCFFAIWSWFFSSL